ncbi:MAG: LPS assembly lipoprotein LptE [Pseudomonadota bacterium]
MSSSRLTRRSVLGGLALLPACGFTPVFAPGAGATALRGAVVLGTPDSANAFLLTRALRIRLGDVETPRFSLAVDARLTEAGSVITRTQQINRFTLTGTATYTLATTDGAVAAEGEVRGFTAYSASGTTVATRAARADAEARLMEILADRILTALAADLSSLGAGGAPA